jgi:hypothetical protein
VAAIYAGFAYQQVTAMRDAVIKSQDLVTKTQELVVEQTKATLAAQQAADAATSAAQTARDELVLSDGTDLEPDGLQCAIDKSGDTMNIAFKSRNMGKRRATNVHIYWWYSVNNDVCGYSKIYLQNPPYPSVVEGGAELPPVPGLQLWGCISTQFPGEPPKPQLSGEELWAIIREVQVGEKTLDLLGEIDYTDFEGKARTTTFKYRYKPFYPTGVVTGPVNRHVWTCDFDYIPETTAK